MHKLIGDGVIHPEALDQMRQRGGSWAAYENVAMDSSNMGHLQFLRVGEDCTFKKPPEKYPADTPAGMGWRYAFVGFVDLEKGIVNMSYSKGETIEVDVGCFVGSYEPQGEWRDAEFIEGPNSAHQLYVRALPNGSPMWVWAAWCRPKERS